jgi:general secretion pathway protein H
MAGYTLLELLVVLGIIGLVATLAAPLVGKAIASAALNADARSLATYLRTQQQLAQSGQRTIAIGDADGASQEVQQKAGLSGQARFAVSNAPLEYFPDGTTTGGSITLHEHDQTTTVSVSWLTGAISIGSAP